LINNGVVDDILLQLQIMRTAFFVKAVGV